jgi:hypothetical protein
VRRQLPKYTLFDVAAQVEQLRNAQMLWDLLFKKAIRTGLAEDYAEADRVLDIGKDFANTVDAMVKDITENNMAGDRVLIDMNTYQKLIDSENDTLAENARLRKITEGLFEVLENVLEAHPEGFGDTGLPPLRQMIDQLKVMARI